MYLSVHITVLKQSAIQAGFCLKAMHWVKCKCLSILFSDYMHPCPRGSGISQSSSKIRDGNSSRKLKPNTHRQRRRDSTVQLRRVGGVYWIRN